MAYETVKVAQYLPAEAAIIFALGGNEYGLLYDSNRTRLEIWIDHGFDGNGCNNLILDAFDKELDLEFCRSEPL
jgi:hypothetical protein